MTTKEAIQAMLDGKKVRDVAWTNVNEYIYLFGSEIMCETGAKLKYFSISGTWEIYEEPKPKQTVVIEKWLCGTEKGLTIKLGDSAYFYSHSNLKKVKLIDTYEIKL